MSAAFSAVSASNVYSSLITQILELENRPKIQHTNRLERLQARQTALSDVDSKLSSLYALLQQYTDPLANPFSAKRISLEDTSYFNANAGDEAEIGYHTLQVQQLASADARVSETLTSTGTTLSSFFAANGTQSFTIGVSSPTSADPDNRETISVSINPLGSSDEEIIGEISTAINSAMTSAYNAGTISSNERATASVVNQTSSTTRLVVRSPQTGYSNRLTFSDSVDGLLSLLGVNDNVVVGSPAAAATTANLVGNTISGPFVIDGSNNALSIDVNGGTVNATLTSGTYNTLDELAAEVETQIGPDVSVSVSGSALQIETTSTGSSASLENISGNALSILGLTSPATSATLTGLDVSGPFVIDGSNNSLDVDINGVTVNATLSSGTYNTLADLAAEVGTQLGPDVSVGLSGNALQITTAATGSSAVLANLGGTSLTLLGLATAPESASLVGAALSGPIVIDSSNKEFDLNLDGSPITATLSEGVYATVADLAAELESQIGAADISVTVENDALKLETTATGTGASLQITGGTALDALGLSDYANPASVTGSQISGPIAITSFNDRLRMTVGGNVFSVDLTTGIYWNVEDLAAEIELQIGSEYITASVDNGTITLETVKTGTDASIQITGGDGLNALGFSVMGVPNTGSAQSAITGTDGTAVAITNGIDEPALSGVTGSDPVASVSSDAGGMLNDVGTSQEDSELSSAIVLDGITFYRDENLITDVLDGINLTLAETSATAIGFGITADDGYASGQVTDFIEEYNEVLTLIKVDRLSNETTGRTGVHTSDSIYSQLRLNLRSDLAEQIAAFSDVGLSIQSDGSIALSDEAAFANAYNEDPDAVAELFIGDDGVFASMKERIEQFIGLDGIISNSQRIIETQVRHTNDRISSFDKTIARRESELHLQFGRLQAAQELFSHQRSMLESFYS